MVIVLLALGLVMILGGIAAVVQGFPYVRLESGLAMVIGGCTAASAGVVLLGLTAVVVWLKRIEAAFLTIRFSAPASSFVHETTPPGSPVSKPAMGEADLGSAVFADLVSQNASEQVAAGAPTIELKDRTSAPVSSAEPWLPEPHVQLESASRLPKLVAQLVKATPVSADQTAPEENKAAGPSAEEENKAAGPSAEDELTLSPNISPDASPEQLPREPVADEPKPTAAPEPSGELDSATSVQAATEAAKADLQAGSALEVIGTYSSGGNTYVMFADGTIEAETPRGRFNFNSLDELKDFVDSGGEHETRGAA